jgi:hypothetical protein
LTGALARPIPSWERRKPATKVFEPKKARTVAKEQRRLRELGLIFKVSEVGRGCVFAVVGANPIGDIDCISSDLT